MPPARGGGSTRYRLLIYSCRYPRPRLKSAVLHCTTTSIPYYPYPAFHGIRRCDLPSPRLINRRKLNGTFGLNFFHGSKVFSIASSYPFRTFSYLYSWRCINPARSFSKKAANIVSTCFPFPSGIPFPSIFSAVFQHTSSYHQFSLIRDRE